MTNPSHQARQRDLEEILDLGERVGSAMETALQQHTRAARPDLWFQIYMRGFFSKGFKSYQAMTTLWRKGFFEDAAQIARSIFEILLQVRYNGRGPGAPG